jgi:hypothetical protein
MIAEVEAQIDTLGGLGDGGFCDLCPTLTMQIGAHST